MLNQLRLAWAYRYFILSSIRNDLFTRFTRSKLGSIWALVNPLVMVAIYAVVLSAVISAKLPGINNPYAYAIYLTSGIMGWTLFSEVLTRCLSLFTGNADLIKKMSFPKITLPLIVLGSCLVNSVFLFAAILVVFAFLGHFPGLEILWVPVLQIVTALMAIGVGIIVGVLNVF
ncbi:MAG TPA: ABC transporter permease, partial [Nitrococcus sp.]|nr:ABC transporter permease [Nitrococcus sp.]